MRLRRNPTNPPRTGFPAKPRGGPCSVLRIVWTHETGKRRSRRSGLGRAAAQARRSRAGRGLAHCPAPSHLAVQEDGHPNAHRPDRALHRGVAKRRASKGEPRGAAQRGNEERERRRCQRRISSSSEGVSNKWCERRRQERRPSRKQSSIKKGLTALTIRPFILESVGSEACSHPFRASRSCRPSRACPRGRRPECP